MLPRATDLDEFFAHRFLESKQPRNLMANRPEAKRNGERDTI
jgi:hypothetical protein